jgi:hypothetical protein
MEKIIMMLFVGYLINLMINRWLYIEIQKIDESTYPNNWFILWCWLSLIGTIILIIKLIKLDDTPSGPGFFEYVYKPKKDRFRG